MNSIDKLREKSLKFAPNIRRDVNMALNEIEAEIKHDYMRLPVDADGVPIRVGDEVVINGERREKVTGVCEDRFFVYAGYPQGHHERPFAYTCTHHHKPTVEDVLEEFAGRVLNSGHQWGLDAQGAIAETAEKIREVLRDE